MRAIQQLEIGGYRSSSEDYNQPQAFKKSNYSFIYIVKALAVCNEKVRAALSLIAPLHPTQRPGGLFCGIRGLC